MTATAAPRVDEYRQRLIRALREVYGEQAGIRCGATRALGYSLSFAFEVTPADGVPQRVFAKARRASRFGAYAAPDGETRAARLLQQEFRTLQAADAWFRAHAPSLGVAAPVAYLDDCHALILRAARGTALDTLVARAHPVVLPAVVRAGRWLQGFHGGVNHLVTSPWTFQVFADRLGRVLGELAASGYEAGRMASLRARVLAQAARFEGLACSHSLLHGDYKLRHIWASETGLQVLDFGNVHHGPVVEDLAAFIVELEVMELGRWTRPTPGARELSAVFLESYGALHAPPLLSLQLILARIKKWSRRRARISSSRSARRVQHLLRLTRTHHVVQRRYLDPWFADRIEAELSWLAGQDARSDLAVAYTGHLAEAMRIAPMAARTADTVSG